MKRILFIISLFLVAAYGVNAHVQPALYQQADKEAMNAWVDSLFASMDEDERIGQLFMIIADVKTTNQNVQKYKGNKNRRHFVSQRQSGRPGLADEPDARGNKSAAIHFVRWRMGSFDAAKRDDTVP